MHWGTLFLSMVPPFVCYPFYVCKCTCVVLRMHLFPNNLFCNMENSSKCVNIFPE
uniref:Uncharacterized protein n=1 Tax=Rhizophora mucronata TaxID=61149 RepID=A0A2P2PT29_RHIMU